MVSIGVLPAISIFILFESSSSKTRRNLTSTAERPSALLPPAFRLAASGCHGPGAQEAVAPKRKRPAAAAGAGKKQGADGLRRQLLVLLERMGAPSRKGGAGGGGRPARSVMAAASGQR